MQTTYSNKMVRLQTQQTLFKSGCGQTWTYIPRTPGRHSRLTWTPSTTTSGRILRARPVKFVSAVQRSWSFPLIFNGPLWEKISSAKFAKENNLNITMKRSTGFLWLKKYRIELPIESLMFALKYNL